MTRVYLPELVTPGQRLGRHIDHDARSLRYLLPDNVPAESVTWERHTPILDQGDVGSCTGNALVGALGTGPLYDALAPQLASGLHLDEKLALSVYSAAETLDGDGPYPPNDNGSSGLSVAKVAKTDGYVSGYLHATSVAGMHAALAHGPALVGSYWYADMHHPARNGLVTATGQILGGHEYLCREYDATTDLFWLDNSWSTGWGVDGRFCYSSATLATLLAGQGDITSLVPISQPAPTPNSSTTRTFPADAAGRLDEWAQRRHTGCNKQAALDWRAGR